MRKSILITLFSALLILIAYLLYNKTSNKLKYTQKEPVAQVQADDNTKKFYLNSYSNQINNFKYENTFLPEKITLATDVLDDFSINRFAIKKGKLVFYFTEKNCDQCSLLELNKIKKIIEQDKFRSDLIVISNFSNLRYLTAFKNTNHLDFEIINTYEPLIPELNVPFYFYLDETLTYKELYFPIKDMPDLTSNYIEAIHSKYFK